MSGELVDTQLASCWLPSGLGNRRDCTEVVIVGFGGTALAGSDVLDVWLSSRGVNCCSITQRRYQSQVVSRHASRDHVITQDCPGMDTVMKQSERLGIRRQ